MAQGRVFVCTNCGTAIEAWDEGHPYYFDERGVKQYVYHPDPNLHLCAGVDTPVLCLDCGARFTNDAASPTDRCPVCSSQETTGTWILEEKQCPYCGAGTFRVDPRSMRVS